MTEPGADRPEINRVDCSDCDGWPAEDNIRISWVDTEKGLTEKGLIEIWHVPDCPTYLIERIMLEDGAQRAERRSAWAQASFPAAHQRLQAAAALAASDTAAVPFVAALTQLVQAQAADTAAFVGLDKWVEILDEYFPPKEPNPKPQ
ncbi:hypothetical protein DDE74_32620 [Streptomyces lydicus]|uniref:PARP-type domain-containing protein n=1 Tax=Streptomyces lydicus TaxID=47763 RepID=A0A3S9YJG7_9ACTN|nr:hypothetical protein [Streptomyces lydicus]AZS75035.1 hypothetical protein DDE74_32620 [Streptomyces lydicus]